MTNSAIVCVAKPSPMPQSASLPVSQAASIQARRDKAEAPTIGADLGRKTVAGPTGLRVGNLCPLQSQYPRRGEPNWLNTVLEPSPPLASFSGPLPVQWPGSCTAPDTRESRGLRSESGGKTSLCPKRSRTRLSVAEKPEPLALCRPHDTRNPNQKRRNISQ